MQHLLAPGSETQLCVLFRQQGAAPDRWSWLTGEVVGLLSAEAAACCRLRSPTFLPTEHMHVGDRMAREEHRDAWRRQPPVSAGGADRGRLVTGGSSKLCMCTRSLCSQLQHSYAPTLQ